MKAAEDLTLRPYLLRAIYDWCENKQHTPYLAVQGGRSDVRLPESLSSDGRPVILNVASSAVRDLAINDTVSFTARFGGAPFQVLLPVGAVIGIFARESGAGLSFEACEEGKNPSNDILSGQPKSEKPSAGDKPVKPVIKPQLQVV